MSTWIQDKTFFKLNKYQKYWQLLTSVIDSIDHLFSQTLDGRPIL